MNQTFQRVAAFCGLRLSYYSTTAFLAIVFLLLAFTDYKTASPLYILLMLALLPSILKAMLFPDKKKKKRENVLAFPLFCKKYHYDLNSYHSMNLAYLLGFLLFAAWHFSYTLSENLPVFITRLPAILATASLSIRILGVLGYRFYFHLFPLKAMR